MKIRHGVTLIEALFVLGIMAILIGMVMVLLSQNTVKEKDNQLITEFATIKDAVSSLCDSGPTSNCISQSGVDLSNSLAKSGLIPNKYVSGSTLVDPFGSSISQVEMKSSVYSEGAPSGLSYLALQIVLHNKEECISMFTFEITMKSYQLQFQDSTMPSVTDITSECSGISYPTSAISVEID